MVARFIQARFKEHGGVADIFNEDQLFTGWPEMEITHREALRV